MVQHNNSFDKIFGVPFCANEGVVRVRPVASLEILSCYPINMELLYNHVLLISMDRILDTLLLYSTPINLAYTVSSVDNCLKMIYDGMLFCNNEHTEGAQCYLHTSSPPTLLEWHSAYKEDQNIFTSIKAILIHKPNDTPKSIITTVNKGYTQHLTKGHVVIVGDKLMLYKPVTMASKYIGFIITPKYLRRTLFNNFHVGPSGGHISIYKTLFQSKTRVFWPRMNDDIAFWVGRCTHRIAYTTCRTRKHELNVFWPITVPF